MQTPVTLLQGDVKAVSHRTGEPDQQHPKPQRGKADDPALVEAKTGENAQGVLDTTRGQCKHQPLDCKHQAQGQDYQAHGAGAGVGVAARPPAWSLLRR